MEAQRIRGLQYGRRAKTPNQFYRRTLKDGAAASFRPSTSYDTVSRTGFAMTDGSVIRPAEPKSAPADDAVEIEDDAINADGTPNLFFQQLYHKKRGPGSYMPKHTSLFTAYMDQTAWPAYPCSSGSTQMPHAPDSRKGK